MSYLPSLEVESAIENTPDSACEHLVHPRDERTPELVQGDLHDELGCWWSRIMITAQAPGHEGKARELADEKDVDEIVDHEPDACTRVTVHGGTQPRPRRDQARSLGTDDPLSAARATSTR